MDQKAFIESIDSTIDRLKKEIRFYNRVIGIGNIIKIVLSASIPILIDQASEHRSLLLIVSIASAIITIIQSGMSAFNYQDKVQTSTGEYKIFCVNEKIHTKKEVPSVE
ncbi:hypothetical protein NUITMVRE12_29600 [Enterococcus faecium]|nr:hypothetical protein NUITMVRE12_29600 [Enterococcus faecium]